MDLSTTKVTFYNGNTIPVIGLGTWRVRWGLSKSDIWKMVWKLFLSVPSRTGHASREGRNWCRLQALWLCPRVPQRTRGGKWLDCENRGRCYWTVVYLFDLINATFQYLFLFYQKVRMCLSPVNSGTLSISQNKSSMHAEPPCEIFRRIF